MAEKDRRFYEVRPFNPFNLWQVMELVLPEKWPYRKRVQCGQTVTVGEDPMESGFDHEYWVTIPQTGYIASVVVDPGESRECAYEHDLTKERIGGDDGTYVRLERRWAYKFRMWRRKHFGKKK